MSRASVAAFQNRAIHMLILSVAALAGWIYLAFFRRGFWLPTPRLAPTRRLCAWPDVCVVIPARDEAATIARVAEAHLRSDYPGNVRVIVVDDASSDGTGGIAQRAAGARPPAGAGARTLDVVTAPALPLGWSGKLNALAAGVAEAKDVVREAETPRYLLLADADILFSPDTLSRLVSKAEADNLALASLMARLDARGAPASLLIPAFIYFFQKLYPFAAVNDPSARTAGAAGGCMLVRADALNAAGGIDAIKSALIDDCALAALLKNGPGGPWRIWLGHAGDAATSLRDNRSLSSIWSMVSRTAFAQLGRSWLLLAACVLGMALIYLIPPLAALTGLIDKQTVLFVVATSAWALMAWTFAPTLRDYGKPILLAIALPVAGVLYTAMTITSALEHARGAGGRWKGRTYTDVKA